ncbi:hypothetical protein X975_22079, partial [Stegodyphus mimosarum]
GYRIFCIWPQMNTCTTVLRHKIKGHISDPLIYCTSQPCFL